MIFFVDFAAVETEVFNKKADLAFLAYWDRRIFSIQWNSIW